MKHTEAISVLKKRFDELIEKEVQINNEITILMQEKEEIIDLLKSLEESIKTLGKDNENNPINV